MTGEGVVSREISKIPEILKESTIKELSEAQGQHSEKTDKCSVSGKYEGGSRGRPEWEIIDCCAMGYFWFMRQLLGGYRV